jgi:hypothetical protein
MMRLKIQYAVHEISFWYGTSTKVSQVGGRQIIEQAQVSSFPVL